MRAVSFGSGTVITGTYGKIVTITLECRIHSLARKKKGDESDEKAVHHTGPVPGWGRFKSGQEESIYRLGMIFCGKNREIERFKTKWTEKKPRSEFG